MKKTFGLLLIILCIGFSACNMPVPSQQSNLLSSANSSPQAWIDAPLNESHLELAPYEIVFHITDGQSALQGELSINDQVIANAANPDPAQKLATFKYTWSPDTPGKYILAVRAQGAGDVWGNKSYAVVYIGEPSPTVTITPEATETPSPTATYTPTQIAGFSGFTASPNAVHFGSCTPNQVTIHAQAYDPSGIATVVLFYRMRDDSGQSTQWINTTMNPEANNGYGKTLNLSSFSSPYQSGSLDIQLVIQNQNEEMVRSQVYSQVGISACQFPLGEIKITPMSIIPMFKTNTPIIVK